MEQLVRVLLVEDDPADADLAREAMREAKMRNELEVIDNGADALAYLRQEGEFADAPRPDLILLDLNLPGLHGKEVLTEIKVDSSLKTIPVVILTSSQAEEDIVKSYRLHANAYVKKPVGLEQFVSIVQQIDGFWLGVVSLPPH